MFFSLRCDGVEVGWITVVLICFVVQNNTGVTSLHTLTLTPLALVYYSAEFLSTEKTRKQRQFQDKYIDIYSKASRASPFPCEYGGGLDNTACSIILLSRAALAY